jgi:IS5 family transposase
MKAHIGVDEETGITHTVTTTPANEHDITEAHRLIRKDDEVVRGDAGYIGLQDREEITEITHPKNEPERVISFEINKRIGFVRKMAEGSAERIAEYFKSNIRAKVERPFLFIKNRFGYRKTRYRGLAKNHARLLLLFAGANLIIASEQGRFCYAT